MGSVHRHKLVQHHLATQRARTARAGVGLLVAALAASATVTASASASTAPGARLLQAEEDPQRVLQSVSVDVAPDGSLTAVDSTSVSRSGGSELTSTDDSFAPAEVAAELPVRVLTSYRLGDRSGTDLSEIEGESGRVVVEVVVQNTTVRPQELTYDVGSTQRRQFALVGAPLTVVATAELGDAGLSRVVTDDGTAAADEPVTNGVLSRTEDDSLEVQWASLLAPPRLSPSMTLRLVQDTESFEVPTFDVNVQPGLVTDTSVQRLLEAAFSDDAGSTLQLESRTISLIGQVTGALEVASDGLSDIEELLDSSARTIGQRTIADLSGSSDRITSELSGLAGDLQGLNTDIDTQLRSTESATLRQLGTTVEAIKGRLGDPATTRTPPPVAVEGCEFDFAGDVFGDDATVFAQLLRVRSQLTAIGEASRNCAADLAEDLRASIGSTEPGFVCRPDSPSLICALGETRDDIAGQASDLATLGTTVAGRFDQDRLEDLGAAVEQVDDTVTSVRDDLEGLAQGGPSSSNLGQFLTDILDALNELRRLLDPSTGDGVPEALRSINERAVSAVATLGTAGGSDSVADQARAAATAACDLVDTDPTAGDAVSVLLTGATCAGVETDVPGPYGGLAVAERGEAALASVTEIAELSDLSDEDSPLNAALAGLRVDVGDVVELVLEIVNSDVPGLKARIQELAGVVDGLVATEVATLNQAYRRIFNQQDGLAALIADGFGDADGVLAGVDDDLADGQLSADSARVAARDAVNGTTTALSRRLERAGDTLRSRGAREIAAQRRRLDTEVAEVTRLLGDDISAAVQLIDTRVRSATGNLEESQRRLVADLARVLTDIGDPGGTGLLGALAGGASQTQLSNQSIVRVSDTASAFRNGRSAAMEDTLLQQAQLARSLELQQELPPLGVELPAGSRHVSVYSFHLEAS